MPFLRIVRTKRVREARDEAKKEIDAYRQAKEEEFKKFEAEVSNISSPLFPAPDSSAQTYTWREWLSETGCRKQSRWVTI